MTDFLKAAFLLGVLFLPTVMLGAERRAMVEVDLEAKHVVGGFSTFDRKKFITIHSSHNEPDWVGEEEKLDYLCDELDVYFGRDTGMISWELAQLKEDPNHRGHVDFAFMKNRGDYSRFEYSKKTGLHKYHDRADLIVAAQNHPFWPDGTLIKPIDGSAPWALADPGATAQYMVYWLNMYTGGNGFPRPQYLEIMNEPLFELLKKDPDLKPREVFLYHDEVAKEIRALNKEVKIGGYTAAFPDFEKDDFKRWEGRWKDFIDLNGEHLDFYSFHLYDFPGIHGGKKQFRKGSNFEATFDMLEHYNQLKWGKVKPFVISEYGSQLHDWFDKPWSPYRDWLCLKATNSMLMQMLAKPDVILKTVPFITAKAEWGFSEESGQPYYWRLLRKENEPESYTGEWVFTEQVKFYELWAKVEGERARTTSSDIDLLVDSYVDGSRGFVILNNLTMEPLAIDLKLKGESGGAVRQVYARHLYPYENKPRLDVYPVKDLKSPLVLGSEATMILEIQFEKDVAMPRKLVESKHYATTYFQKIESGKAMEFQIPVQRKTGQGVAVLRLGVGRDHGLSLQPLVWVNGEALSVSGNYRGPLQTDREEFFGVLEFPVPAAVVRGENTVSVKFPDAGGHVSSVVLQIIGEEE